MASSSAMPGSAAGAPPTIMASHHGSQYTQPPLPHVYCNNNNNGRQNGQVGAVAAPISDNVQLPERHWSMMTRTIAHYERLEQIGEGTYGQVYKARCKDTDQIVALKKIRVHHGKDWGMPPTVIREIKILKRLQHPNLVRMMEVVSSKGVEDLDEEDESTDVRFQKKSKDRFVDAREGYKGNLFLVLEYVSHDLTGLMDVAYRFTPVQVKCIFRQLLEALRYMHEKRYIHRDIKSSNILLDHHFRVKLADFGLARCIEPPILDNLHDRASSQEFTNKVITLWYRPPEILMGATKYGPPVDVWSAGCILAELLLGKPLFTGKTEMDQLQLIFELLGTPSLDTWEGLKDLKLLRTGQVSIPAEEKDRKPPKLRTKYARKMPSPAMNLLEKLLELDPRKRLTAERALDSRYFLSEPVAPERPEDLGPIDVKDHFHEFQTKKKRRQAKKEAEKAREAAKSAGMDDEQAQEQYDTCYRKLMKKVASEGIDAFGSSTRGDATTRRDKKPERKVEIKEEKEKSDRDRDRNKEDRRRRDSDSSRRREEDGSRRDRDESRRKRRREHDDGDDRKASKERRVAGEDGEEPDAERKDSKREKSSRDRRSSREKDDKDRERGDRDRDRDHRRRSSTSRRKESDEGRDRDRDRDASRRSERSSDKRRDRERSSTTEDRGEKERVDKERPKKDRGEKDRVDKERTEKDREEKDRVDKERTEKDRGEKERVDKERTEKERSEKERDEKEVATGAKPEEDKGSGEVKDIDKVRGGETKEGEGGRARERSGDRERGDDRDRSERDRDRDRRDRRDRKRDRHESRDRERHGSRERSRDRHERDRDRHSGRDRRDRDRHRDKRRESDRPRDRDRRRDDHGRGPPGDWHGHGPPPMDFPPRGGPGDRGGPPDIPPGSGRRGGPPAMDFRGPETSHYGPGPGGPPPGPGGPPFRRDGPRGPDRDGPRHDRDGPRGSRNRDGPRHDRGSGSRDRDGRSGRDGPRSLDWDGPPRHNRDGRPDRDGPRGPSRDRDRQGGPRHDGPRHDRHDRDRGGPRGSDRDGPRGSDRDRRRGSPGRGDRDKERG